MMRSVWPVKDRTMGGQKRQNFQRLYDNRHKKTINIRVIWLYTVKGHEGNIFFFENPKLMFRQVLSRALGSYRPF